MKNTLLLLIAFISINFININAQDEKFTIVFYNVENLFDTIDSPGIKDSEFTPEGAKNWNTEKYYKKLDDLARVFASLIPGTLPEIIGLAEVENSAVLSDLINTAPLSDINYGIVHETGADPRGIDVALLYDKDRFQYKNHNVIKVAFPDDTTRGARDILHVTGTAPDGEDIHFFVNHWNSRIGGVRQTETMRMFSAVALRRNIDLILTRDSRSRIVIMGDLNDEPTNQSVMNVLQATNKRRNILPSDMFNLFYDSHNFGEAGSYFYRGNWNMLDQIIISYNMINREGFLSCDYNDGMVFMEEWMLYETRNGESIPSRTYSGNRYTGGVSDHLPVYVILMK